MKKYRLVKDWVTPTGLKIKAGAIAEYRENEGKWFLEHDCGAFPITEYMSHVFFAPELEEVEDEEEKDWPSWIESKKREFWEKFRA